MNTLKRILAVTVMLTLCVGLCACSGVKKKFSSQYFEYFDSFSELTVFTTDGDTFAHCDSIFKDTLESYHRLLDAYNTYDGLENVCTLNSKAHAGATVVSRELFDALSQTKQLHALTNGYTSITLGALTSVWKTAIANKTPPSQEELTAASAHIDIDCLVLDEKLCTVAMTDPELRLDLGAVAKGYVADRVASALSEAGCDSFLINLGGTVRAHGVKDSGEHWKSGISDPISGDAVMSLDVTDMVLSTSGSYHRGFDADGTRYHHIINPFSLMPENTFCSVSVLCHDGAQADALSTALFSMTLEAGKLLAESIDGAQAVWILADGSIVTTDNLSVG